MKIGIDARIYPTGIWRYSTNLLNELANIASPDDQFVVFLRQSGFDAWDVPDMRFKKVLADFAPYSFAEQLVFPFLLYQENCDLIHFTNFNVPILWPRKFVVTIHDLIHQSHSTFGSTTRNYFYYQIKRQVYSFVIRYVAWRAARVIVPSQATKDDLHLYLQTSMSKMPVTYEGMDKDLISSGTEPRETDASTLQRYGVEKPYFLYVATMYPHKNHRALVDAFLQVKNNHSDIQLVFVGKVDQFSTTLRDELQAKGVNSVVFPNFLCDDGYLPDEDLKVFYRNAQVYAFPSLKEGFGIPLLEAQMYNVPVAASAIACLQEVGGDSALYFDPESKDEMAGALESLLTDNKLREDLIHKGRANIARFSWKQMAEQTYAIYQEVLE